MALLSYYTPLGSSIMRDMIGLTINNMGREAITLARNRHSKSAKIISVTLPSQGSMPKPQAHSQGSQAEARTAVPCIKKVKKIAKKILYCNEVKKNRLSLEEHQRQSPMPANINPAPKTIRLLLQSIWKNQVYIITNACTHCPMAACSIQHR